MKSIFTQLALFCLLACLCFQLQAQIVDNTASTTYTRFEAATKTWGGSHALLFNAYMSGTQVSGGLDKFGNTKYFNHVGAYGGGAGSIMFFGNGGMMDFLISPTSTGKNTNVNWGIPKMRIMRNGFVGIGTTAPAAHLDINGVAMANYMIVNPQNTSLEGGELRLDGAGTFNQWHIDNYAGRLRFHHSGTSFIDIKNNGNVGIGTNNPESNLHIHSANNDGDKLVSFSRQGIGHSFRFKMGTDGQMVIT
ncbi:MAG: hypothetical protein AAF206_28050, partial [Bacteroidota bacterium]